MAGASINQVDFPSPALLVQNPASDGIAASESEERQRNGGRFITGAAVLRGGERLSDLPEDNDVLAINWRRLPMPLETIVARNKKIVHAVKDDDLTVEPTVRAYFRQRRQEQSLTA